MSRVSQFLLPLVNLSLLLAVVVGLPFAWILRDGLGPDSTATTGIASLSQTLATFFIGPIILLLLALNLYLRNSVPQSKSERNPINVAVAVFLALLAFTSGLSTWAAFCLGLFSVAIGPWLAIVSPKPSNRALVLATIALPLTAFVIYWSVAIHMYQSLGGWPDMIGMDNFSANLALHADVALFAFGSILIGCIFVLPVAALLCLAVPQLRGGLPYLAIYAITCFVAFIATQMAPDGFLYWWWD